MKKHLKLMDLDCAHCAAQMEEAIKKIDGVNDASVNFLAQKLTVEADEGRFDEVLKAIVKVCRKIEPDCIVQL